jgi:hypothetical protein
MDWIIDELMPAYDFRTRYTRRIAAEPARVWAAMQEITFDELPATRLLMALRTAGRARLAGTVADGLSMPALGRREGSEAVLGRVAKYWRPRPVPGPDRTRTPDGFAAFAEPGWAKGLLGFQLSPLPGGHTLLAAETRVQATDAVTRRLFAGYWLVIRAGGAGFIRHEMLRAIARHAEATRPAGTPAAGGGASAA